MALTYAFFISGLAIVALLLAKRLEMKYKRRFFLLRAVSKRDVHVRELYHKAVHAYSDAKERTFYLVTKHLPLHVRNYSNKALSYAREKALKYLGDIRDSRLLNKPDGMSEFFKNVSDIEKGNGEINESLDDSQNRLKEVD